MRRVLAAGLSLVITFSGIGGVAQAAPTSSLTPTTTHPKPSTPTKPPPTIKPTVSPTAKPTPTATPTLKPTVTPKPAAVTTINGWNADPAYAAANVKVPTKVKILAAGKPSSRTLQVQRKQASSTNWETTQTLITESDGLAIIDLSAPAAGTWDFKLVVTGKRSGLLLLRQGRLHSCRCPK